MFDFSSTAPWSTTDLLNQEASNISDEATQRLDSGKEVPAQVQYPWYQVAGHLPAISLTADALYGSHSPKSSHIFVESFSMKAYNAMVSITGLPLILPKFMS